MIRPGPTVPVILVFHGGGQDAITIAKRWYVDPPNPLPADLAGYLLVFPETDPLMDEEWVHFSALNTGFPTAGPGLRRGAAGRARRPGVRHRVRAMCRSVRADPWPGLRGRLLQRRRDGLAAAELLARRLLPGVRRGRHGPRAGEGPALPQRAGRAPARYRRRRRWSTCTARPTAPTGPPSCRRRRPWSRPCPSSR